MPSHRLWPVLDSRIIYRLQTTNQLLFCLSCNFSTISYAYTCLFGLRRGLKKAREDRGERGSADLDMDIAGLPSDILVEVTASIATRSATPLIDVVNLRRS